MIFLFHLYVEVDTYLKLIKIIFIMIEEHTFCLLLILKYLQVVIYLIWYYLFISLILNSCIIFIDFLFFNYYNSAIYSFILNIIILLLS